MVLLNRDSVVVIGFSDGFGGRADVESQKRKGVNFVHLEKSLKGMKRKSKEPIFL